MTGQARTDAPAAAADPARELREKKQALAALVVHDLRNPLAAALGYVELGRADVDDRPQVRDALDEATRLIDKALTLVATILDIDELEEGILRARRQPVRLRELLDRVLSGNRPNMTARRVRVEVACARELEVSLDPGMIERVLENLIDNGVRYAPVGGRLAVAVTRHDRGIELAIGNDGPEIPVAEREAIFGRYHQVDARRAAARANRGLGLYFCKLAADAHGGTIHVERRGALGAVFVLDLPA